MIWMANEMIWIDKNGKRLCLCLKYKAPHFDPTKTTLVNLSKLESQNKLVQFTSYPVTFQVSLHYTILSYYQLSPHFIQAKLLAYYKWPFPFTGIQIGRKKKNKFKRDPESRIYRTLNQKAIANSFIRLGKLMILIWKMKLAEKIYGNCQIIDLKWGCIELSKKVSKLFSNQLIINKFYFISSIEIGNLHSNNNQKFSEYNLTANKL